MKKIVLFLCFYIAFSAFAFAQAESTGMELSLRSEVFRGQPLVFTVFTPNNAEYFKVKWQGITIEVPAEYVASGASAEVMMPTIYDKANIYTLAVTAVSANGEESKSLKVKVQDKEYPKESLTVEPKYVNPGKAAQDRIAKETPLSRAALRTFSAKRQWVLPISKPSDAVSGVFGEQRVFNGVPKSKHSGMDFRAKTGDPIYAVADGKVVLTGDFYYNGQFVFVDHGQGMITAYLHMSEIIAKTGDDVA
ncbi:MAG: M23 family metallopeptidase, partial [Deferribacteraceae bacterium]|nr:M23 family metallopeptidase [Deferribacteraceae bacterium]